MKNADERHKISHLANFLETKDVQLTIITQRNAVNRFSLVTFSVAIISQCNELSRHIISI